MIIFKAMCGTKPYDPKKQYCLEGELYDLCNGKMYDQEKQYCKLNTTVENYGWLTDSRDNKVYKTVVIGEGENAQTWMAQNLDYGSTGACLYKKEENCVKFGRFYTWSDAQSVCPEGWHLPSQTEWETLYSEVGGKNTVGLTMKSKTGWNDNGNGHDLYGFSILPAGHMMSGGGFGSDGSGAYFWSSTTIAGGGGYGLIFFGDNDDVLANGQGKTFGNSVRCVKDN